jgi:hypothetical protein
MGVMVWLVLQVALTTGGPALTPDAALRVWLSGTQPFKATPLWPAGPASASTGASAAAPGPWLFPAPPVSASRVALLDPWADDTRRPPTRRGTSSGSRAVVRIPLPKEPKPGTTGAAR